MKVLILAAGRGARFGSITSDSPKSLIAYKGKPLLYWTIQNTLHVFNKSDINIIVGYQWQKFSTYSNNLFINLNWDKTNIMGSLSCAKKLLSKYECLVIYADIYFEAKAINLITQAEAPSVLNVVNWKKIWNLRFVNPMNDLENFRFDKKTSLLTQIGGRAQSVKLIQGQFGGMFTTTPQLWKLMNFNIPNLKLMDTTSALQKAIENGAHISKVDYDGAWAEFDTLNDLKHQV